MITLREAKVELLRLAKAGCSASLIGESGCGKSWTMGDIARQLKIHHNSKGESFGLCVVFGPTQDPSNICGLQWKGTKTFTQGRKSVELTVTDPAVPTWILTQPFDDDPGGKPAWLYDACMFVVEEEGQCDPEVKRQLAEIMLMGGFGQFRLPVQNYRYATTNTGTRYGVTKTWDHYINRVNQLPVMVPVSHWIEDFANKPYYWQGKEWEVSALTKAWGTQNPQIMSEAPPKEQGPWCTYRSATENDRYYQVVLEDFKGRFPDRPEEYNPIVAVMAGKIGMPATQSFMTFMKFQTECPSLESICVDPEGTPVPKKADAIMLTVYQLAEQADNRNLSKVMTFVNRIQQKDMQFAFIRALLGRENSFTLHPSVEKWKDKHSQMFALCRTLAG